MLARVDDEIRTAEPGLAGATCPLCDTPVIGKCGTVNIWHWAHRTADCDTWSEPMSPWHLSWQELAPKERREVVIGNHRADIVTPRGVVVEIQRSQISPEQIAERERHYVAMVWIFDATSAATEPFGCWCPPGRPARDCQPTCQAPPRLQIKTPYPPHDEASAIGYRAFRWRLARRSLEACQKPIYLDLGSDGVLLVGKLSFGNSPVEGWGHLWTRDQVAAAINEPYEETA